MPLAALIFDVDGTLAETEEVHRHAFNAAFAAAGLGWHWEPGLYATLLAVTGGKERICHYIAAHGGDALGSDVIAHLHADKTERYAAAIASGGIALRPGVRRLLDEAQAEALPVAIATTTSPANVTALLRATLGPDAPRRFAFIGAGDVVAAKKPAPDIYRLVLERLGLPPERCIALEDTPNGLRAALGAGIPTVVTLSQYGPANGFDGALAVMDHLGEPDRPCRMVRGPAPAGGLVGLAALRSWLEAT